METIDELADAYVWTHASQDGYDCEDVRTAYLTGAEGNSKELTKWNNPFVKDMPKDNVLVKYIAVGCPNNPYYTIGRREPSGRWNCENKLATDQPRFEIVGWREIHE